MSNNLKKVLCVFFLTGVLLAAGCETGQPGNDAAGTDEGAKNGQTNTNGDEAVSPTPSFQCEGRTDEEVATGIQELMKKDEGLRDQVKNVVLSYSEETVYVKGYIYGPENVEKFYEIIDGVSCAQNVSYRFMTYMKEPPGECSGGMCQCGAVCTECPCVRRSADAKSSPADPETKAN